MKPGHVVSLIEAAYRVDSSPEQWLERIATAGAAALGSSRGAMAFQYDASPGSWVHTGIPALHGLSPEFAGDLFNQPNGSREAAQALAREFISARLTTLRGVIDRIGLDGSLGAVLDRYEIDDMLCVNGLDPSGRGCVLSIAIPKGRPSPRAAHVWQRLAAHISAGNRLGSTLAALAQNDDEPTRRAEAILAPNGNVEHATGAAEPRSAREALREALARIDAARAERDDARRSVDLWRGLVAGRWSLVEHFERDGRRYYLAHKNDPEVKEDRALTLRERQVLGYAELGNSNKVTAYALGISSSTVSTLLARARRKIGMTP